MKAYEFAIRTTPDGKLELPEALKLLPGNQVIRTIFLINEPMDAQDKAAWSHLAAEQFLAGYSEADAVYDRI